MDFVVLIGKACLEFSFQENYLIIAFAKHKKTRNV